MAGHHHIPEPRAGYTAAMKRLLLTAALLGGVALAQTEPPTTTPAQPAPTAPAAPATPAPAPTPPAAGAEAVVVAKVGNDSLTLAQYEAALRLAVANVLNEQGMEYSPEYLKEFADAREGFLKQFAQEYALYTLARGSVQPDATQVDAQLTRARSGFESDAEFDEALAATGYLSSAELRADLERQYVVNTYIEKIRARSTFGDAVVAGFYNLNKAQFTAPKSACARHILVRTEAEAKALAEQVKGGADFAALAKDKSQDPGSAGQGGDLGCFEPGDMVATFDKASFSGPVNEAQVVQSEFGWHVLLVSKRSEGGLMPLAEAAPLIRARLAQDAAQKYIDSQIARLKIELFPATVKATAAK